MATTFTLRVVGGNSSRRFELRPGDISRVGRGAESNILIPDPNISRHQLTVQVHEDHIDVEMNAQSSNQLCKNGQISLQASLVPGEFFDIGPYRFELEATSELPQASAALLPPDPAGPIDIALGVELQRIAPRWNTVTGAGTSGGTPAMAAAPASQSPIRRFVLPLATVLVALLVGWDLLGPDPTAAREDGPPDMIGDDLLASVTKPNCHSSEACMNQAREFYKLGEKLRESGSRDLITLYRIAKQFRQAQLALDGHEERLPELHRSAERARSELMTAFTDIQFRLERARSEGDLNRQLAALQAILLLCEEDSLSICIDRQRSYQQIHEQMMQH